MPSHFTQQKLKSFKKNIRPNMIQPHAILFSATFLHVYFAPSSLTPIKECS